MAHEASRIVSRVKRYRQSRGLSQEQLSKAIGVGRQAIYDIESGRYLPNTGVALRLARLFGCRVEDLFSEAEAERQEPVTLVAASGLPTTRLALARVRDRLVGYPLAGRRALMAGFRPADALLDPGCSAARTVCPEQLLCHSVLLLGCDPAFDILAAHVARLVPAAQVICGFASSRRALEALAAGNAHLAGTHLHNHGGGEANVALAAGLMGGTSARLVGFALIEEGLMLARGNPKGIASVADLARSDLRLVNRENGAALRVLLDDRLAAAGIPAAQISGYHREVGDHIEGAQRVACGIADAALGLRAIAEAFDLGFLPLATARCDLVIPEDLCEHPVVQILLDTLQTRRLCRELAALPGYDASVTGKAIARL